MDRFGNRLTLQKAYKSNPEGSVFHKSVAYIDCVGLMLHDLGINHNMNPLNCGEYCKKFITRVTLVGSNPSQKSPDNSAFHPTTKSRQFVDRWFDGIKALDIEYMNLIDEKTKDNKSLTKAQIYDRLDEIKQKFKYCKKIVACGKIAAMGLTMAGIEHFEMPHPSGLCRFWNNEEAGEKKVKEMLEWLKV